MKRSLLILILILAIALFASGCAKAEPSTATPNTNQENNSTEQSDSPSHDISSELDDYMASLKEQSDIINASLEQDSLTQQDMNLKSQELYVLWDDALNYLWSELKNDLQEEEFAKLLNEQLIWIADKEAALKEAGKEFEGGSLYALVVNSEAAKITEERVYELYALLKAAQ